MILNRRQFIGATGAALAGTGLLGQNATASSETAPQVTTFDHFDDIHESDALVGQPERPAFW